MKKKIFSLAIAAVMGACMLGALAGCKSNKYEIAVFAYKYDDSYIATVRTALAEKFKKHDDVNVTFYNGENNQQTQSAQIDTAITKGADLLIINAVDFQASGDDLAAKCKEKINPQYSLTAK